MIYEKFEKYWKIWLWVPIILLVLSIGIIANNILTTGSFMQRDIELTGGKSVTFEINSVNGDPTIQEIGPTIGNIFFQQAQIALIAAFILMAITVIILFRSVVPSLIVILAATADIVITVAILHLTGVALSLPVIAALLMVIGYSVDTNMVLTSELLKSNNKDVSAGIKRAMKTGLTMTSTIFVALFAMYFLAGSVIIEQIAFVLIIGTLLDAPTTWMTNAGILRMWLARKRRKE